MWTLANTILELQYRNLSVSIAANPALMGKIKLKFKVEPCIYNCTLGKNHLCILIFAEGVIFLHLKNLY